MGVYDTMQSIVASFLSARLMPMKGRCGRRDRCTRVRRVGNGGVGSCSSGCRCCSFSCRAGWYEFDVGPDRRRVCEGSFIFRRGWFPIIVCSWRRPPPPGPPLNNIGATHNNRQRHVGGGDSSSRRESGRI